MQSGPDGATSPQACPRTVARGSKSVCRSYRSPHKPWRLDAGGGDLTILTSSPAGACPVSAETGRMRGSALGSREGGRESG
eukprot:6295247-Prymnesium_polylepis.1